MKPKIRNLEPTDWTFVAQIYAEGIATGNATFQTDIPNWEDWDTAHIANCRLVAVKDNIIMGWAALTPISSRCVYAGVAEISVYVGTDYRGQGVGKALLEALIEASENQGLWTLKAGIFPENTESIALHHGCGFRTIGYQEKIGKMGDIWRDTLLLERRSKKIK